MNSEPEIQRKLRAELGPVAGAKAWKIVAAAIPEILARDRDDSGARAALREQAASLQALADARDRALEAALSFVWLERDDVESLLEAANPGAHVDDLAADDLELRARVLRALEKHTPTEEQ